MNEGDDDTEKQHEPTQKKLDDARRKGDIPRSTDLTTAAAYAGLLLTVYTLSGQVFGQVGAVMAGLIEKPHEYADQWFTGGGGRLSGDLILAVSGPLALWFGLPALIALAAILAMRSFVVAPEKVLPKLSRISLISNAKNKYGASGLFEFFKSFLKLSVYSVLLTYFLLQRSDEIISVVSMAPSSAIILMFRLTVQLLAVVVVIAAVIGAMDMVFQQFEHTRKNRMSRKELMDETKQSEGDPHMKQQRRQRAYDIATNQMLQEVPEADVVIVNPTHYAVALKWARTPGSAPECVAKGVDEVAARIRERAIEHGVPIQSDPATARAIYGAVEIGQEIQPEHYQAVAAAIRFAEAVRAKAKAAYL